MEFLDKHKALIITALISGTLVLAMFAIGIKQQTKAMAESYYELPPPLTPEEQQLLEEMALNDPNISETNKAYNSANEFKEMMKNFKTVNSDDFDQNAKKTETEDTDIPEEVTDIANNPTAEDYSLNENELSSYSKINNVIAMRSAEKRQSSISNGNNSSNNLANNSSLNTNSSVSYSLVNRKDKYLPPPVYLCEESGKIVINITVNNLGEVIDAYVNTSSTSKNACLIESALQYANEARFSPDASNPKQIGSITYHFKGKNLN
ncbi:energy transducer TonB [Gelidibacter japonicus]|uniref:energy transducer TonB family protein n=1 Tax=Gelidibacter japonicus TaxID=1962232 RepID=UPI001F0866C1|nr:energy transducer TonB [Gelidibacter japonicus]MCL8008844.1 energy transducer TonB [Gelidibacter japonicus]